MKVIRINYFFRRLKKIEPILVQKGSCKGEMYIYQRVIETYRKESRERDRDDKCKNLKSLYDTLGKKGEELLELFPFCLTHWCECV